MNGLLNSKRNVFNHIFEKRGLGEFFKKLSEEEKDHLYQHIQLNKDKGLFISFSIDDDEYPADSFNDVDLFFEEDAQDFLASFVNRNNMFYLKGDDDLRSQFEDELIRRGGEYFAYGSMICDLLKKGDIQKAEDLLGQFLSSLLPQFIDETIRDFGRLDVSSISGLDQYLNYLISTGKVMEAINLFERLSSQLRLEKWRAINILKYKRVHLSFLLENHKYDEAKLIYEEVLAMNDIPMGNVTLLSIGKDLLTHNKYVEAMRIFEKVKKRNPQDGAEVNKIVGNYFLDRGNTFEACQYFEKAVKIDPSISGVKSKLRKLSKMIEVKLPSEDEVCRIFEEKEGIETEWYAKRNLANEYVKLKKYDRARKLFDEALSLRGPCDTIYSAVGRMLEKEGKYEDALVKYLLAYKEVLPAEAPKYLSDGIDRCLRKLGLKKYDHSKMYEIVREEREAERIEKRLSNMIENREIKNR